MTIQANETLALHNGTPVRSSFLPFHQPLIDADDELAVVETLRSGWLTTGPRTEGFETELASYAGSRHCVAVNACTATLRLALEAAGVGSGDEVITSPITFASTANVIVHRGRASCVRRCRAEHIQHRPRFARRGHYTENEGSHPGRLRRASVRTRHDHGAWRAARIVIEDAGHAIAAEYKGRRVGGSADMMCFSFYATRNITSGEGGALTRPIR